MDDWIKSTTILASFKISDNIVLISPDIIRAAGRSDLQYNKLIDTIQNRFKKTHSLPALEIRKYWKVRQHLSIDDGLVLLDQIIVIPTSQRAKVLRRLHSAHQGEVGMKACANESVYCPRMNASIRNTRAGCTYCSRIAPSQPNEPIKFTPSPDGPFQQIVMDLFLVGNHEYLACTDRLTGYKSHPTIQEYAYPKYRAVPCSTAPPPPATWLRTVPTHTLPATHELDSRSPKSWDESIPSERSSHRTIQ